MGSIAQPSINMPHVESFFKHLIRIDTLSYLLGTWRLTPRLRILMFWPFFLSNEFRCLFLLHSNIEIEMLLDWPGTICLQIVSRLSFCLAHRLNLHILRPGPESGDHLSSDCSTDGFLIGSQAPSPQTQTMHRVLTCHPIVTRQLWNLNFHKFLISQPIVTCEL